jgi:hypothetical protein
MSDPETTQVNALSASDEMIRLLGLDKPAVEPTLTPLNPPSPAVSDVQEVVKDDKPETPTVTTVPPSTFSKSPSLLSHSTTISLASDVFLPSKFSFPTIILPFSFITCLRARLCLSAISKSILE